eukprot:271095-Pleurochrysis_carterae.AAC.1
MRTKSLRVRQSAHRATLIEIVGATRDGARAEQGEEVAAEAAALVAVAWTPGENRTCGRQPARAVSTRSTRMHRRAHERKRLLG